MPKLTVAQVASLSKPGRYADGNNLYLKVSDTGAKSWTFFWRHKGKRPEIGLGSATGDGKAGKVSLATARQKARAVHDLLSRGIDPREERRKRKRATFGEAADQLFESLKPTWKSPVHTLQWETSLKVDAKKLRSRPVAEIDVEDILKILKPIWHEKHETAVRLRGRLERVLDYAKVKGWRSGENPAAWKGNLQQLLGAKKKLTRGHHKALAYADCPGFMEELRKTPGVGAKALEFTILTAARSGETYGAVWGEFDLDAGVWTIPGARMKGGKQHIVPLSPHVLGLLKALPRRADNPYVFPGRKPGTTLSNMAMTKVIKDLDLDVTVHGFRSSFRDYAGNQTNFPREVCEECLAHEIGNETERAYRREAAVEKRRDLLLAWETFLA
ncbi:tyrosine-type recombinase/integrase [Phyllobacterium pellucidum]|uniref:tyrosine-type recombinase/integrase n=1 Tax=Phyllobacterium pellucidum TaxID=2740464 RepID=UPI001D136D50|nr:site-specific integrase [Phyllobacterium sp. T1018]UGY08597.1 integrase arm-type DNA-binding domain-containing protein [Phyllobacterium sp. T1018]